ncbi:unnamed protein product [Calicophoron daubneyi]|uniref:EGF-like domain-containing protein n=1 Tax=Calicophoron daubneyi TaxID=300641 RepID=A0AAV2T6X6_CALDB
MDIPNVLLVLMLSAFSAKANVKVTFTLKNYENRNNLDVRLRKCESFSFLGDNCDPYFHFSAYTTNANGKRAVTFTREVGPFMNKKEVANVLQATQIQQLFPDLIEIDLDIHDNDVDEDQRIAHFRREIPFLKAGQIELTMGVDVRITVILKVECLPDYFGERCDVYCTPMPDLWTCNKATGARVCSKPCIHGSCVLTNTSAVCVCADGWSGDLCMMSTKSSVISTIILPELPTIKDEDKKLSPETATKIPIIHKNRQAKNQEPQIPDEIRAHPAGVKEQSVATVAPRNGRKATSLPSRPHINSLDGKETGKEHGTPTIHNFSNSTSNITAASSTLSQSGLSLQTIILIVVILSVCWLCVMIAVGVVLYRRRRGKKGSNHLGYFSGFTGSHSGVYYVRRSSSEDSSDQRTEIACLMQEDPVDPHLSKTPSKNE